MHDLRYSLLLIYSIDVWLCWPVMTNIGEAIFYWKNIIETLMAISFGRRNLGFNRIF